MRDGPTTVSRPERSISSTLCSRSHKRDRAAHVRYRWADFPDGNLYNTEGLPAAPFRSE